MSRVWLTQLMQSTAALLEPIYYAQLESDRASRVKAMDETPIKAGPTGSGKMKAAYFWPVYGEQDEICFLYYPSRSARHVQEALGLSPPAVVNGPIFLRVPRKNDLAPLVTALRNFMTPNVKLRGAPLLARPA